MRPGAGDYIFHCTICDVLKLRGWPVPRIEDRCSIQQGDITQWTSVQCVLCRYEVVKGIVKLESTPPPRGKILLSTVPGCGTDPTARAMLPLRAWPAPGIRLAGASLPPHPGIQWLHGEE